MAYRINSMTIHLVNIQFEHDTLHIDPDYSDFFFFFWEYSIVLSFSWTRTRKKMLSTLLQKSKTQRSIFVGILAVEMRKKIVKMCEKEKCSVLFDGSKLFMKAISLLPIHIGYKFHFRFNWMLRTFMSMENICGWHI